MATAQRNRTCDSTPWGLADSVTHCRQYAFYATPSHGGCYVTGEALAALEAFHGDDFRPWAGPGWYEEDSDALLVYACLSDDASIRLDAARQIVLCPYYGDTARRNAQALLDSCTHSLTQGL